ncbi:Phytoene dehydrogenase [Linum perenne]
MELGCRWRSTTIPCSCLINSSPRSTSRHGFVSYRSKGFGGCFKSAVVQRRIHAIASLAEPHSKEEEEEEEKKGRRKKVAVIGSGWAGLDGNGFGSPDDAGIIQGFWYPYKNIFSLVDELGIKPFTNWMKSAVYSSEGLEAEFPVFRDLQQLPAPLGTLFYTQFNRLPWLDRLTSLPLMAAVVDFDNTEMAWRKYDSITARELFKRFGCSERLFRQFVDPLIHVGLFAPPEQCSAAATLGILYYTSIAHQKDFDVVWCRGAVKQTIFDPWKDSLRSRGCRFIKGREVKDMILNEETGSISAVVCSNDEVVTADAVILAAGISTVQELVKNSAALRSRDEFLKVLNLASIDVITAKLWLDKKVNVPNPSNACAATDESFGWTFFHLNTLHDEHKDNPQTVLQADFFNANEFLPLNDEEIARKVVSNLSNCVKEFENAKLVDIDISTSPKSLTHFFPGSYKHMMRGSTSFPNVFMAGDWIINRHGSWSQEKAYVTGLEAANRVVDLLEEGSFAKIIPVEEDEAHVQALRSINRQLNDLRTQLPFSDYFLQ